MGSRGVPTIRLVTLPNFYFCKAFGWTQVGKSNAHIDAIGPDGLKYQFKGRRITPTTHLGNWVRSAILPAHTSSLVCCFAEDYTVLRAAIIPHSVAME